MVVDNITFLISGSEVLTLPGAGGGVCGGPLLAGHLAWVVDPVAGP